MAIAQAPKCEFRGAWIHTVFQEQYRRSSTEQNKARLCMQLDSLHAMGINAVIFQVRPQADAFYASELEPWSCYLTDAGKAPVPAWDPLRFMIDECHRRGMELHAWLNPYRVTSSAKQIAALPGSHLYHREPGRFVTYDRKLYFDPGLPENRDWICRVVADIVSRYDVDGIHFDDYFYPYPVAGKAFPDDASFKKYGGTMKLDDWRRHNVDLLIEEVHKTIAGIKPWVRFGISPFGIYRNKTSDPRGSDTHGLENYDSLYADVLLWAQRGWVDYLMPQLYWELEHKSAAYEVLLPWWNDATDGSRHIYIGQDVDRTMTRPHGPHASQLHRKIELARSADRVQGVCWWPAYSLLRNTLGVADSLCTAIHATPALVPPYPWLCSDKPKAPRDIRPQTDRRFSWQHPAAVGSASDVVRYAIYRFESRAEVDIRRPGTLVSVVAEPTYTASEPGVYVVTALNRANIESNPSQTIYLP